MAKRDRLLEQLLAGEKNRQYRFQDVLKLLQSLGFELRIKGSHHILNHEQSGSYVNIQPTKDGMLKHWSVKEVSTALQTVIQAEDE